jgi:DNA-binding transcriptional ArsR family regulator
MSETTSDTASLHRNEVFGALAHERRRTVLQVLDRLTRASPTELATHLVAAETGNSLVDVEREAVEHVLVDLQHVHLPKLDDAGLVEADDGAVTTTAHPALQDPKLEAMLAVDDPDWNNVLQALTERRRRIVLTTLYREDDPMAYEDLALAVARTELAGDPVGADGGPVSPGDDAADADETGVGAALSGENGPSAGFESVLSDLHHVQLPVLEGADLVSTDGEAVAYEGHPELDEEWLVAGPDDTPRAILSSGEGTADIWTLEGRDDVTERGRALCEAADEELFMMFTVEGTVETACVRRIRDAIDRDVDVYVGTQNQQLRDLVREHVPEATIWEPQMDWLNLPPTREKVGRLILADREEIIVGTIGDEGPNGRPVETAITGSGEYNPLVMLLREMLGSRLDHLDAQSEDFLSEIPL